MARRFRFKLAPVLKYRASQEEERLREFARAQGRVVEQEAYLAGLADEKLNHQDAIADLYRDRADFERIQDYYRFINTVNLRSAFGRKKLGAEQEEMEKRRQVYLEARKKRRALELLEEKRRAEHRREEDAEEARFLDELSIQRFRAGDRPEDETRGWGED